MKKIFTLCAMALLCSLALVSVAAAQWQAKSPISLVVCYTPGGATDFQARLVSMPAADEAYFGQPIVILNKPGAGGMTGWNWMVNRGSKDGYTVTAYNMPHLAAQAIVQKSARFTIESFEPVGNWGADPAVLIVAQDSPYQTVDDLVAFARENPGKVTLNGAGLYVGHHIAMLQFEKAAGINITYIPEQGGTDAFQAVYAGNVICGFNNLADAWRNQGRLRILAIADNERHPFLPDVPTFKELGYDIDDTSVNYRGFALPAGTPQEIIDTYAEAIPRMFNDPMVVSKMEESGSPLKVMNREEVIALFRAQDAKLRELLKD